MKKEEEVTADVETELKLPLNDPIEDFRNRLNRELGGVERVKELTSMYDNLQTLGEVVLGAKSEPSGVYTEGRKLLIPESGLGLDIASFDQFEKILGSIGFFVRASESEGEVILANDNSISQRLMNDVQDSRLRLRRKEVEHGDLTELSYKRPLQRTGVKIEIEYETAVKSFDQAERLLSILGFVAVSSYERFRSTWKMEVGGVGVKIELDEFPFGSYVEIEGTSLASLERCATDIGLDANAHIERSYDGLYEDLMFEQGLEPSAHIRFSGEQ